MNSNNNSPIHFYYFTLIIVNKPAPLPRNVGFTKSPNMAPRRGVYLRGTMLLVWHTHPAGLEINRNLVISKQQTTLLHTATYYYPGKPVCAT